MFDLETISITGVIKKIIYKNPENNFLIAKLQTDDSQIITVIGNSFDLQQGERVIITGKFKEDLKYGRQLEIESTEIVLPTTKLGIEKFLGSGLIKGIGPITAKKITEKFGLKTLEILDKEPEKLFEIEGLAQKKIETIKNEWVNHKFIREIIIFMQSFGISSTFALKIYNKYQKESINILKSNPYKLIDDIYGIGFKTADLIADKFGIEKESKFRIKAGILYLLNEITESGHCFYPKDEFLKLAVNLLDVKENLIEECLKELNFSKKIFLDIQEERIYLNYIYNNEKAVAHKLLKLKKNNNIYIKIDKTVLKKIDFILKNNNIVFDEDQLEAINSAITENVLILTGSPGTGKSTILKIIIDFYNINSKKVLLAAPTGRAAKRLSQATNFEAKTIHRLLKYQPKTNMFLINENNKLDADVIIIDEASMIDIKLFKSLMDAIKVDTKIILVGDSDQLPAVGPGNILSDIINSNIFKVVRLKKIYRQEGQSKIIYNSHRIRDGLFPVIKNSEFEDFYFIDETNSDNLINTIIEMITERIPSKFDYDPLKDIQVIVPTNKGTVGSNNLNKKIQENLNKSEIFVKRGDTIFKFNDKIIQLKNNYEKEVFNGDIGFIRDIDFEMKEIKIEFDDKIINYDFFDLDQINLSYAITIHKSQGSEFKCVIIPILTSHYMLLQRNLLYTAITRAKELAILIGSKKAIGIAVNKNIVENRFTTLKELLRT